MSNSAYSVLLDVVEFGNRNYTFSEMMTDPGITVLMASHVLHASREGSDAPTDSNAGGLFKGMSDPYEWKSAVTVALIFFVLSLALAPALTPDQKTLAAEINTKTLKAADAVRSSTR